jgi:SH3-like domain-containing protein
MLRQLLLALSLIGLAGQGLAIDYRSVDVPAAILYDAPSQKGQKLYLIKAQTPVEVIVRLEGWVKVRDAEGSLAWIEAGQLAERRTLVVIAPTAQIRQADNPDAPVIAELDKWVAVDLLGPATPGWAQVKHRDGATGFIRTTEVWGL